MRDEHLLEFINSVNDWHKHQGDINKDLLNVIREHKKCIVQLQKDVDLLRSILQSIN